MIEDLYKRKIIRDYLSLFSENKWKQLIPLTLEFGIMTLRSETNVASISLEDIAMLIEGAKEKLEKKAKTDQLEKEQPQRENRVTTENSHKARSKSTNKEAKASSNWRKGDAIVFKKKKTEKLKEAETASLNSDIYPKWWGTKMPKFKKEETKQDSDIKYSTQEDEKKPKAKNKKKKRSTNDEPIRKFVNPVKSELKEIESKIKDQVERDKKLFNIQKQNTKTTNIDKANEYSFPRKNKTSSNVKTIMASDYKIEYDKSLKPQAIREKSIERKVLASQANIYKQKPSKEENVDFIRNEPKTKVSDNNIDSDNNPMSDTEGGLSSYAPSERTKNFFVNQFKDNSNDKSSVLSNSLNYSEDQMNNNYNEDYKSNNKAKDERSVKFNNNYVNRTKN